MSADTQMIVSLIDSAHESKADRFSSSLGPSMLGNPCDRYLWLSFRWAVKPSFNGRMKRLFRRGHKEEETIIDDLKRIGVSIGAEQKRVNFAPHVSGAIDAIAQSGVPGDEFEQYLLEFKTHNKKSFDLLVKQGVKKAKPNHYVQMQLYIKGTGLKKALYIAVCKDDDRMHVEKVDLDDYIAKKHIQRAIKIVSADSMPSGISSVSGCKYCEARDFCHNGTPIELKNCRTCAHSRQAENSTFECLLNGVELDKDRQILGCQHHEYHKDMT